jgi:hypothetical protein
MVFKLSLYSSQFLNKDIVYTLISFQINAMKSLHSFVILGDAFQNVSDVMSMPTVKTEPMNNIVLEKGSPPVRIFGRLGLGNLHFIQWVCSCDSEVIRWFLLDNYIEMLFQ